MADDRPVNDLFQATLQEPVEIDGAPVTEITLRRPKAGELRGLSVSALMQLDVTAMLKVLPRITVPPVPAHALEGMDPADFTDLATRVSLFFVKRRVVATAPLTAEAGEGALPDD